MSISGRPDHHLLLPIPSPKKKHCTSLLPESEDAPRRSLLLALPLELLAEILIQTNSPRDILAVARTSKFLCSTLVCNSSANFIWRIVRKKCLPSPLPDPTPNFCEAAYAAFVYDGGFCEMCGKHTNDFYVSFATRIRLCRDSRCRKDFTTEHLVDVTTDPVRSAIWTPYVESTRCFAPTSLTNNAWPENPIILMRKSEWKHFRTNYATFSALTSSTELRQAYISQITKFPKVMGLAVALQEWKYSYVEKYRTVKGSNETWAKALARQEGWNVHDLLSCQSYGSLQKCKTSMLEEVTLSDFLAIKSLVEVQLLKMQEHRHNKQNEASYRQRRNDIEQYYNRLRSTGTVVPSLSEFRKLPVMKTVQGSVAGPRPNSKDLALDLKKSNLVTELVTVDLKNWMELVRERLSQLLGCFRWRSASKTKLHPLDRITARFSCQRCGTVSKQYDAERCLDFRGVCMHECPKREKKNQRSVNWNVEWFVIDQKASNAVACALTLAGIAGEDTTAQKAVTALGAHFRCLSCDHAFIVMDFSTLVGHSHRHINIQIAILPEELPEYGFQSGLATKLRDTNFKAKKARSEVIYCCRYCIPLGNSAVSREQVFGEGPLLKAFGHEEKRECYRNKKSKYRPMDFNALCSHLKGQHGIEMVSDEDFLTQRFVL